MIAPEGPGSTLPSAMPSPSAVPTPAVLADATITGTTWQLVEIQYMDDTVATPTDPAQYTLLLNADGTYNAQIDCNSTSGAYTLAAPQLTFSAGAMTLVACAPESLSDQMLQGLLDANSFVLQDGDLFIAFGPDSGILHFTPASATGAANVIAATFVCADGTSVPATFDNEAENVTITLPDGTLTLPQVVAASGARYSDGTTTFWNKGNEATLEVNGTVVYESCVAGS